MTQGKVCKLALEDGLVFTGTAFGAEGTSEGEVVFNTAMTGYQEVLTDPSYAGQIVTMTYPQIGNYGVNAEDIESRDRKVQVRGFVVKEFSVRASNLRAAGPLDEYLRTAGAMNGVMSTDILDDGELVRRAAALPPMKGMDLVKLVAPRSGYDWPEGYNSSFAPPHRRHRDRIFDVVAIDCGAKTNILRNLVECGCKVAVVPATATAEEVLRHEPEGLFISNGPGDPAAVTYTIETLRKLVGKVPIFGICLGHQLLALAMGAETFKLKFGHRGANHPVRNQATGKVEITSQNHGFAVDEASLGKTGAVVTHVNLNDQTVEGFSHPDEALFSVQYHPEASPGPHDATYLFDCFGDLMETGRAPTGEQMHAAQERLAKAGQRQ